MSDYAGRGRLAGKVALITGGARGQGAEEGRLFAAEGAMVMCADINEAGANETAAKIGKSAIARKVDVTQPEQVERMVAETVKRWLALKTWQTRLSSSTAG